jgi:peptidyl-prolyl cis-trans isomerase A (cyclophilin A)
MLHRFALFLAALYLAPAAASAQETIDVVLETEKGDIVIALEAERAPVTAANFLRYVDEGRLDGTVFYRAMRLDWGEQPNGLIQGGTQYDPERILDPIAHEPTTATGLSHTAGTISMARYEPGSATGDFSIMLAAFGRVIEGMDVVRAIFDAPTDPEKGEGWMKGQMLAEPVKIIDARRNATD